MILRLAIFKLGSLSVSNAHTHTICSIKLVPFYSHSKIIFYLPAFLLPFSAHTVSDYRQVTHIYTPKKRIKSKQICTRVSDSILPPLPS